MEERVPNTPGKPIALREINRSLYFRRSGSYKQGNKWPSKNKRQQTSFSSDPSLIAFLLILLIK